MQRVVTYYLKDYYKQNLIEIFIHKIGRNSFKKLRKLNLI
jgi:hypothetical protein